MHERNQQRNPSWILLLIFSPLFHLVQTGIILHFLSAKSNTGTSIVLTGLNSSFANFNSLSVTSGEYILSPHLLQTRAGTFSTKRYLWKMFLLWSVINAGREYILLKLPTNY